MIVTLNNNSKKINNSEKKVLIEMLAIPNLYSREEIGKFLELVKNVLLML